MIITYCLVLARSANDPTDPAVYFVASVRDPRRDRPQDCPHNHDTPSQALACAKATIDAIRQPNDLVIEVGSAWIV